MTTSNAPSGQHVIVGKQTAIRNESQAHVGDLGGVAGHRRTGQYSDGARMSLTRLSDGSWHTECVRATDREHDGLDIRDREA